MPFAVVDNEALDPVDVCLLGLQPAFGNMVPLFPSRARIEPRKPQAS
jgi:hypothetical protein